MACKIFLTAVLCLSVVSLSVGTHYHQNHHGSQVVAGDDHRVDEKEYAVDSWSPYWLICAPIVFIPLILLLCTPLFHRPHEGHHHGGHEHHSNPGHGWGTYNQGWKRSSDLDKEEVTGRVLKSISKSRKSLEKTKQI
ncbi:unnamed protein product [Allacma fusca]|uniref:Uncharacterized protein n=1 Tax=Allacma fusca TaxID=39272 RepID=A0A8J2JYU2_9HEXA|nr:unnamed protein product [Allacma fusca]